MPWSRAGPGTQAGLQGRAGLPVARGRLGVLWEVARELGSTSKAISVQAPGGHGDFGLLPTEFMPSAECGIAEQNSQVSGQKAGFWPRLHHYPAWDLN